MQYRSSTGVGVIYQNQHPFRRYGKDPTEGRGGGGVELLQTDGRGLDLPPPPPKALRQPLPDAGAASSTGVASSVVVASPVVVSAGVVSAVSVISVVEGSQVYRKPLNEANFNLCRQR